MATIKCICGGRGLCAGCHPRSIEEFNGYVSGYVPEIEKPDIKCDEHDHSQDKERLQGEKPDQVFRPAHYTQWKIEPFTFLMLNKVPFAEASICKYVLRWRKKNGLEDLKKAKRIIDMMIEMTVNKEDYIAKKTCL